MKIYLLGFFVSGFITSLIVTFSKSYKAYMQYRIENDVEMKNGIDSYKGVTGMTTEEILNKLDKYFIILVSILSWIGLIESISLFFKVKKFKRNKNNKK